MTPFRKLEELLGVEPITVDIVIVEPVLPRVRKSDLPPYTPPTTPEDRLARKAVAAIEREEGFHGCAEHRLNGAYDGDSEHRIALKAIELFKALSNTVKDGTDER